MADWQVMTEDNEYIYSIVSTASNAWVEEPDEFPCEWTVGIYNEIIQPFEVSYTYNNVTYSLGFNPNLYPRSGTKTISDTYITMTFNYSNLKVTVTKRKSSGYAENAWLRTLDVDGGTLVVSASPKNKSKTAYESCAPAIVIEGLTYRVQGVSYMNCVAMVDPPDLPSDTLLLFQAFSYCTSLTSSPVIPSSVTNMYYCFYNCTSLVTPPVIPDGVTDMRSCFQNCTSLMGDIYTYLGTHQSQTTRCFYDTTQPITLHAMNDNIEVCDLLAATANNGNVLVNVHPETPISFTDTQMNYMTNEGLRTLSLQTNANLVQCEIPDLVNGGTITTNVNDALIDLCNRNPISYTPVFEGTVTKSGVTFTNNGDGSFTVNGTAPMSEGVSQSILNIDMFPPAQYKMTGGYRQKGGSFSYNIGTYVTWSYVASTGSGGWEYSSSSSESTTSHSSNVVSVNITFKIAAGQTVNNVTFTPVIMKVGGA